MLVFALSFQVSVGLPDPKRRLCEASGKVVAEVKTDMRSNGEEIPELLAAK